MNADSGHRKGEIAELKSQLRQLAGSRAPGVEEVKRELYKKVISYMTIGIDVSSLFSEMVMCSATSDLVVKKMCYLYVGNYAKVHPDLALLTINFLQRDCQDDDPMIRGLALRSLCSLRVMNFVEYLVGSLRKGLKDNNGYVRQVAAMGVLKLYHIAPTACIENDFVATLKSMLSQDPDAQVVANCLCALEEILVLERTNSDRANKDREMLHSKQIVFSLLNRIKDFSEWAQCLVLDMVSKYIPVDPNETFDIMNLLEDRLQHSNSAVVLATIKVFLQLTISMADVHQQVYERIKAPLLTLISSGSPELSYAVLSHLHLLVMRAPILFSSDYKHFYCRYSDPSYVKKLKIEMLTAVASESNMYEIVTELSEYAANVDVGITREAIRAVGKIALNLCDVNAIVDRLLQFLEMERDYVTAETLVLVKDLVRKYPEWSHDCIAVVGNVSSKSIQEPKAKAALIWMLGEYSHDMLDAPYVLESFVDNWLEEDSPEVRLELLTAAAKIFFKRPPESQKLLGAALAAAVDDPDQDVHDKGLFYYRLLQQGVQTAESIVNPPKKAVSDFADIQNSEMRDRIFDEFNSLSVIYREPSYMFLDKEHRKLYEFSDEAAPTDVLPTQKLDANDNDLLLGAFDKEESQSGVSNGDDGPLSAPRSPSPTLLGDSVPPVSASNIPAAFGIDDLLGLNISTPPPPPPSLVLSSKPVLDSGTFQKKWSQLPVALSFEHPISAQSLKTTQPLLRHMQEKSVQCMASGGQSPTFKFFFFAQKADGMPGTGFFLVECLVHTSAGKASVKVKSEDSTFTAAFSDLFKSALSSFII
ncbi:beta-adaptin-like protein A isoform X1 [Selaginella moellendorffii]|uniref:beta-adaptin-like protein A isoform X1 n=1 Tax=Selaginella moellendorffii TaxID=88036 RepID=UPI000D1CC808|nr:beta-adaptin-like protein A isoform X1 [Selaginella moellendorffii]|eukprot:XP_024520729.1 beta-adaptin-like protein A isoform X1 [Selaginella moellendorffii]